MKFLGSFAVIAILLASYSTFADEKKNAEHVDALAAASSAREAMLESMADPIANKAFHTLQLQMLQTPSDAMVYNYFAKSALFAPLYQFLVQNNDSLLMGFELQAKSGMVQAVRGLTPQYDLIDKLVVEVATSLGFTKEAITNRQIYVLGGDENAFTVSGSQNKIIVAFQRGILRTMTRSEIAGVLAHELGHIRAEHTVKGIMNSIMLEMIGELFVNGRITVSPQDANISKLATVECHGCALHRDNNSEKLMSTIESLLIRSDVHQPNHNLNIKLDTRNAKLGLIDQQIQQFVIQFASMPKPQLQKAVASYLRLLIQIGQAEKAPMQSINYFATLLHNVSRVGTFRVNMQEYLTHAKMVEYAISRAKETTADQISAATVRNEHLASSFSKLIGLDFEKEYRPQIFEQIKKQAQDILTTTPPEMLYAVAGTTHPSLVLRINNVLNIQPYPSVLFANNYLRLLLLNDALMTAEAQAKAYMTSFEEQMKVSIQDTEKMIAEAAGKSTPEEIAEIRAMAQSEIEAARKTVQNQLHLIAKSQRDHEAKVFKLLFESEFRVDADRAPRMDNTIQYLSVQREVMFINADAIKKRMQDIVASKTIDQKEVIRNEMELEQLKEAYKSIMENLNLQKAFIERVKDRVSTLSVSVEDRSQNNLKKRYVLLNRILEAKSSVELAKIRARVTGINPNWREQENYRSNKIPLKIHDQTVLAPGIGSMCSRLFVN